MKHTSIKDCKTGSFMNSERKAMSDSLALTLLSKAGVFSFSKTSSRASAKINSYRLHFHSVQSSVEILQHIPKDDKILNMMKTIDNSQDNSLHNSQWEKK